MSSAICSMLLQMALGCLQSCSSVLNDALTMGEMDDVIIKAPTLTLLLPLDRGGALDHASVTFEAPAAGLTCWNLLNHIYSFYQVRLHAIQP